MPKRPHSPDNAGPKKKRYASKFQNGWLTLYSWLHKSDHGENFAYCKPCNSHFSIAAAGKFDVNRHQNTNTHKEMTKASAKMPTLTSVFLPNPAADKVTKAEVLFTNFVAEHNIPFSLADHFTHLCKEMFTDSDIAKKFACKRTKTTHILNNALAPELDQTVTQLCQTEPYSVLLDESNDKGDDKRLTILVRVLDRTVKRVTTRFLYLPNCNIGNGENIFNSLQQVLLDRQIPWANLIGYCSDNASVMIGKHNSVLTSIKQQQPIVFNLGCICHLANICCQNGVKKLPLPVDELLVDIYFHFHHSAKRKEIYNSFMEFTEVEPLKILKHCSTRWLSLQNCVNKLLHHWPALSSYFQSHDDNEKPGRVQRCASLLTNDEMHMYFHFLDFILAPLNNFNTTLQRDDSMIGYLHQEMTRLLRKFMGKFVQSKVITAETDITQVDFTLPANQLPDDLLAVGLSTRTFIADKEVPDSILSSFFKHVRLFYTEVTNSIVKKFPFKDTTLQTLGFVNPTLKHKIDSSSLLPIATRLVPSIDQTTLADEVLDYQLSPDDDLPLFQPDTPLDNYWLSVEQLTIPGTTNKRFTQLPKLALAALTLPHSNAAAERSFSMLKKIQADTRGNLCTKTINSLMSAKMNTNSECYNFKPTTDLLKKTKDACAAYKLLKEDPSTTRA